MSRTLQDIAPGIHIRQYRRARFDRLVSPIPGVIRVEAGEKRLASGAARCVANAGSFALLGDHSPLTVENVPPLEGAYAATALAIPRPVFEAACARLQSQTLPRDAAVVTGPATPELASAFEAVLDAFRAGVSGPRRDLVCEALALELALAGLCLPPAQPARLSDVLRGLLAGDLARNWSAQEAGAELGISPATLRRKLRAEGAAFNDILRELRLASGLHLLQTTRWPVASVAQAVGYGSASRFTQRFRERFDIAPCDLRKPIPPQDRSSR